MIITIQAAEGCGAEETDCGQMDQAILLSEGEREVIQVCRGVVSL
jgi:hypothetical protein